MDKMMNISLIAWALLLAGAAIFYFSHCSDIVSSDFEHLEWWEIPGVFLIRAFFVLIVIAIIAAVLFTLSYPLLRYILPEF